MANIIIKKFGPITEAEFETQIVTVFIGNQSSGKSTLAKIISFSSWIEKEAILRQDLSFIDEAFLEEQLLKFHKVKTYRNKGFYIKYEGDVLNYSYSESGIECKWTKDGKTHKLSKIAYIPSTRNLIAIPGLESLMVSHDNIRSFVFDWLNVHRKYNSENRMDILDLGVSYYYNENGNSDTIILDNGKELAIDEASSGLQSLVPLYILIDYLTRWIYENKPDSSFEKQELRSKTLENELRKILKNNDMNLGLRELAKVFTDRVLQDEIDNPRELSDEKDKDLIFFSKIVENFTSISSSKIIIEEPEQNLFPRTQRDLIYYLIKSTIQEDKGRYHELVLTTHSPYVLYALNNCMMGGLLGDKIDAIKDKIDCKESFVDPRDVAVYGVEEGITKKLQQEDGLIGENYFEVNMKGLMDDFYKMLNYYE